MSNTHRAWLMLVASACSPATPDTVEPKDSAPIASASAPVEVAPAASSPAAPVPEVPVSATPSASASAVSAPSANPYRFEYALRIYGATDKPTMLDLLKAMEPEMSACLKSKGRLAITVGFSVAKTGKTSNVGTPGWNAMDDSEMHCLLGVYRNHTFPEAKSATHVSVTISMERG